MKKVENKTFCDICTNEYSPTAKEAKMVITVDNVLLNDEEFNDICPNCIGEIQDTIKQLKP